MAACDELSEFDLITLREAVKRGSVKVVLVKEGRPTDLLPVKERMDKLVECGFLERTSSGGSKARMTGAEFFACYTATLAGRVAIEALDELEAIRGREAGAGSQTPAGSRTASPRTGGKAPS